MKLTLLPETTWRQAEEARVMRRLLTDPLTRALLRLVQSSGLGAPPALVAEFADWLRGNLGAARSWDHLMRSILNSVNTRDLQGRGGGVGGRWSENELEQALRADPFAAARLLLFPTLRTVLSRTGENMLVVDQPGLAPPPPAELSRWQSRMRAELDQLAQAGSGGQASTRTRNHAWRQALAIRLFQWLNRGADVSDPADPALGIGRGGGLVDGADHLLRMDMQAAQLFLAATQLKVPVPRDQALPRDIRPGGVRASGRQQMEGVEGVRQAPPGSDPSTMLPHQMVYPFEILVDMMMNDGFLALDRPPPLPRERHFIFAALVQRQPQSPGLSLLRAAWWLACRQVEIGLRQHEAGMQMLWLPRSAGSHGAQATQRRALAGDQVRPTEPGSRYLMRFSQPGDPFTVTAGGATAAVATGREPDTIDLFARAGIDLLQMEMDTLGLFTLSISVALDEVLDPPLDQDPQLVATGMARLTRKSAVISPDGKAVRLGHGALRQVPEDFDDQAEMAVHLATELVALMYGVIGHE